MAVYSTGSAVWLGLYHDKGLQGMIDFANGRADLISAMCETAVSEKAQELCPSLMNDVLAYLVVNKPIVLAATIQKLCRDRAADKLLRIIRYNNYEVVNKMLTMDKKDCQYACYAFLKTSGLTDSEFDSLAIKIMHGKINRQQQIAILSRIAEEGIIERIQEVHALMPRHYLFMSQANGPSPFSALLLDKITDPAMISYLEQEFLYAAKKNIHVLINCITYTFLHRLYGANLVLFLSQIDSLRDCWCMVISKQREVPDRFRDCIAVSLLLRNLSPTEERTLLNLTADPTVSGGCCAACGGRIHAFFYNRTLGRLCMRCVAHVINHIHIEDTSRLLQTDEDLKLLCLKTTTPIVRKAASYILARQGT